jgi:hypothetical protein
VPIPGEIQPHSPGHQPLIPGEILPRSFVRQLPIRPEILRENRRRYLVR